MFYFALEVAVILIFFVVLRDAIAHLKQNRRKLALLVLAVVYTSLFENFNILIAAGKQGAYYYNSNFLIFVGHVPLFASLLWASLIYTAMHITDRIKVKQFTKPFLDALAVLILTLMSSVVLARQGVQTWIGFSAHQGWFGAPADHFIAILFMTFIFSYLFRYFSKADNEIINKSTRSIYYFLLPAFAYLGMLVLFSVVNLAEDLMSLTTAEELFILWAIVVLFAAMIRGADHREPLFKSDTSTVHTILFVRLLIIFYVMWSVVLNEIYRETTLVPILLVISIAAEIFLYAEAFKHKKNSNELEHY